MEKIIKKSQFVSPVIVLPDDTDPKERKCAAWQTLRDNGMTCKQIGEMFGVSASMIYKNTETTISFRGKHSGKYAHERAEMRRAYYIPLMLELRKLGYSNVDIGAKTGFHANTIRKYIGRQPDEVTLTCHRVAGAKRRLRNLAVKNQLARDNNEPIPAVAKALKTA